MRIAITAALLVIVIIARQPCSDSVGKFVTGFGSGSGSNAEAIMPKPGNVDLPQKQDYEVLGSNMTQAEFDAIQKRAQARAEEKKNSGSGTGTGTGTGTGSATP